MSKSRTIELAKRLGLAVDDVVELFTERAAIREIEGGATRVDAETGAFEDVRATFDDTSADALLAGPRRGPVSVATTVDDDALDDAADES